MTLSAPWKNSPRTEACSCEKKTTVKKWATALAVLALLAYPFLVWMGLQQQAARPLALLLLLLLGLRWLLAPQNAKRNVLWMLLAALIIIVPTLYFNRADFLLFYPVLMNASMLLIFFASLFAQQSAVEKIARLHEPDLPPAGVRYTRRVTQAWCVFFVANGAAALYTALYCTYAQWALYNGLLSYVLIAAFFLLELLWRRHSRPTA